MSSQDLGLVLCDQCAKFQDLDAILTWKPLNHHVNWTELCRSAKRGCHLCQAFIKCEALKRDDPEPLEENFDEHMDPKDTQITWTTHTMPEMFMLKQEGLFFAPYVDVLNLWVEFYAQPGMKAFLLPLYRCYLPFCLEKL